MGLCYQFLVVFIYQITKTLPLPIDPSAPLPSPHRTENNLRMRLSIDPGIGQTSRPLTSFTIAPILSVEASTPSFTSELPSGNSPPLISPGNVAEHLPIIGSAPQYSKHTLLDPLNVSSDLTSSFFDDLPSPKIPGLYNDNTPLFLPIIYPGEITNPLNPMGSSLIIDNTPKVVPFMTVPIETSKPVLTPIILLDKSKVNPSELQLAGITVPMLENRPSVNSSIHLTRKNLPLTDKTPSINTSIIHPTGISVPVIDKNSLVSPSGTHLTGTNLPLTDNSPSISTSGIHPAGISVPLIDNNQLISPSSFHLTEINLPFIDKSPSVSHSGLQPSAITVPIVDNNLLISLSSTYLSGKNLSFIEKSPSVRPVELQLPGIPVHIIDKDPFIIPSSLYLPETNLSFIDKSPSGLQLIGSTVPTINNSLISPAGIHLTGTNLPFIDKNPFVNPSELQLAEINATLIKNNPTVVPPSLKMSEIPKTQPIPNIPGSRSSNDPLTYITPLINEVPQIESHVSPPPTLNIHFQIHQLNVPSHMQKELQPLQYNCFPTNNLEAVSIVPNISPPQNSDNSHFFDQLHAVNHQMVYPKVDNKNNFLTVPTNIVSPVVPSNISPDIMFKGSTNELLPETLFINNPPLLKSTDELKLVNLANNLNLKPEIPLQLHEHASKNTPLTVSQNPSESLLKLQSLDIALGDKPINPKAHVMLNNELKAVQQSPGRCSESISVISTPSVLTNRVESILNIPKNHLQFSGDLSPNILPSVTSNIDNQFSNLVVLNNLPNLEQSVVEIPNISDDISHYIPANVAEQKYFSNTPVSVPSSKPYTIQNIVETAPNLDSFVPNYPMYPDILSDYIYENLNIVDSNKFVRSSPYAFTELDSNKIEPVIEPSKGIISLTNMNMSPIPTPFENILKANPYSNYILKDDTLNSNVLPLLPVIPSNAKISSNIGVETKNVPDLPTQYTLMPSFPRSFSPLNTLPPFQLCTPFIKSPSFLPKPSLSKLSTRLLSTELSYLSSLLQKSNSSTVDILSNTKSIPCITSVTINIIPVKEECNPEIIIVL